MSLAEDPNTDLSKVIPIRLYGDGAEAQSLLSTNSELQCV